MTEIFKKMTRIFFSSFDENGLIQGISDIIIVKWDSGQLYSTPFLACFGYHASVAIQNHVYVYVNDVLINGITFTLDKYGYINPIHPSQQVLKMLNLRQGRNTIKFQLRNISSLTAEVYLFDQNDKILVSDMDGTLTKSDACGIYSNYKNVNYLHDGYHDLIGGAYKNGYKIVWLTMRSLPLYRFSKDYVRQHSQMHGALIMEPQQFFPAAKKQILKKTGHVKANMLLAIKKLFPEGSNPLVGGLGNRQNDAIAYRAAGIPLSNIFIIDTYSNVHHFGNNTYISYQMMSKEIEKYFPKLPNKCLVQNLISSVHKKKYSQNSQIKDQIHYR